MQTVRALLHRPVCGSAVVLLDDAPLLPRESPHQPVDQQHRVVGVSLNRPIVAVDLAVPLPDDLTEPRSADPAESVNRALIPAPLGPRNQERL